MKSGDVGREGQEQVKYWCVVLLAAVMLSSVALAEVKFDEWMFEDYIAVVGDEGSFYFICEQWKEDKYEAVRYSGRGEEVWRKGWGRGDEITDVTLDAEGNAYVTGWVKNKTEGGSQALKTVKYGPEGKEIWAMMDEDSRNECGSPAKVRCDNKGGLYVVRKGHAASEEEVAQGYNDNRFYPVTGFLVSRYEGAGVGARSCRYSNGFYGAADIATDSKGNLYIAESRWEGDKCAKVFAKYAPDGKREWIVQRSARVEELGRAARRLAVDETDNVYLVESMTDPYKFWSALVISKYDADGELLWKGEQTASDKRWIEAERAMVDSKGNLYVVGENRCPYGSGERQRLDVSQGWDGFVTVKFSREGDKLWASEYWIEDEKATYGTLQCVMLDGEDNVYLLVTKRFWKAMLGGHFVIRYDVSGKEEVVAKFKEPEGGAKE